MTDKTTVRFTRADMRNLQVIIRSGSSKTVSGAIRVALYEAAQRRTPKAEIA